jgi:hypothetical protein
MKCKICDRVKATEDQHLSIPEDEGEHLCWGDWSETQCHSEQVDWYEKYQELHKNFKALDRYNDVLYRCYWAAVKANGEIITGELAEAITAVERFENELYREARGTELRPSKEDESGRHLA